MIIPVVTDETEVTVNKAAKDEAEAVSREE
jgi:hypothetical protein